MTGNVPGMDIGAAHPDRVDHVMVPDRLDHVMVRALRGRSGSGPHDGPSPDGRPAEPVLPATADIRMLEPTVRAELRSLTADTAETVGRQFGRCGFVGRARIPLWL